MSRLMKSVVAALVIVTAWTIYDAWSSISVTGSYGLGAVSFGISEALVELVGVTAVAWFLLFLKSRLSRSRTARRR